MPKRILRRGTLFLAILTAISLFCGCYVPVSPSVNVTTAVPAVSEAPQAGELTLLTPAPEESSQPAPLQPLSEAEPTPEGSDEDDPTPVPTTAAPTTPTPTPIPTAVPIAEDGEYTSKEDVALYLHVYGRLPKNFMTKNEARVLGWEGGGLDSFAYGKCIGGDRFGNYEGLLPEKNGRRYFECDIDTLHARSRGSKRIIYSNDGLIYYTSNHYESFTLLYGDE